MSNLFLFRLRYTSLLKLLALVVLSLFFFQHTKAQLEIQDKGIAISPAIMQFEANPGETIKGTVFLKNATPTDLVVSLLTKNFTSNNENGAPQFIEKQLPLEISLADWIVLEQKETLVEKIEISESHTAVVNFTINVPANAEPGGYYAAIIANNKDAETDAGGNVQFRDSRGTLILLTVNGEIDRQLELVKFYAADPFSKDRNETNLFEWFPVSLRTRLSNSGNVHIIPYGNIVIYQGGNRIAELKFNAETGNILRESTRTFENIWGDTFFELKPVTEEVDGIEREVKDEQGNIITRLGVNLEKLANLRFGQFTAQLSIAYDANNSKQSIVAEYEFWVIPWKLILFILVFIIVLVTVKKKLNARARNKK